jgi:enoyl-CoA hydratase/carnithine racemase
MSHRLSQLQTQLSPAPEPLPPTDLVLTSVSPSGHIVTLTINHASRANSLSTAVLTSLLSALRSINPHIEIDESIDSEDPVAFAERVCSSQSEKVPKVVIIKSVGKVFCSGHDLRELKGLEYDGLLRIFELCNTLMMTIQRLPQIVISQVALPFLL